MSGCCTATLAVLAVVGPGCAQPSRMRLADAQPVPASTIRWWCQPFEGGARAPILGVEATIEPGLVDQWLLSAQGVRRFRYRAGRMIAAGPPLPPPPVPEGLAHVRRWLEACAPELVPGGLLKNDEAENLTSLEEVHQRMAERWPASRVEPPAGLTPGQLAEELEDFPHGVLDLAAIAAEFGG